MSSNLDDMGRRCRQQIEVQYYMNIFFCLYHAPILYTYRTYCNSKSHKDCYYELNEACVQRLLQWRFDDAANFLWVEWSPRRVLVCTCTSTIRLSEYHRKCYIERLTHGKHLIDRKSQYMCQMIELINWVAWAVMPWRLYKPLPHWNEYIFLCEWLDDERKMWSLRWKLNVGRQWVKQGSKIS